MTDAAMDFSAKHWPEEINVDKAAKTLEVVFTNGERFTYTAEYLRVESPSAEVQGHSPDEKQTIPGKRDVGILGVEPAGNYAVQIIFDDTHDSGLYDWETLYKMGVHHDEIWADYLANLEKLGLSRDPE